VRLGAVHWLAHHGRQAEALERFERIQSRWPLRAAKGQLQAARRHLESRGAHPTPYRAWLNLLRRIGAGADDRASAQNSR
jgi:hypothetical protein